MVNRPKPLVLLILDGFGYREEQSNNAIALANTPCWDQLQKDFPTTLLDCAGDSVGLPDQVRPEFRFHQDQRRRADCIQDLFRHAREVEGEKKGSCGEGGNGS